MEEFDFNIKDQVNKDLLKQLMDQQIDVIPSDEKQKLIDRTGGKKELGRTAYSMLKMVFELLEGDEITEEEKNTLREVMRKSTKVQIKNIPYQFFEMHKEYLLNEDGSTKFPTKSMYFYINKPVPFIKGNKTINETKLKHFCKMHTNIAYSSLKHKPKFYTATESRSASGRSYPFFEFKDNKSNTMNRLSPTNMKVIQRVLQVIPSVNPILINWQSRLFTVMHLTMIALDRKDRTLKEVLLHFLKNYGLDENGHLPIELLKEAQSKVTKTVYMKVGKKGMDDYIGLDKLFKSFNNPEKYGTQSIAPIDAVAQNWVIFMANVVRNPKFFKNYPIPTDTKTKFYDVKGEDPNTYHANKFANAIIETLIPVYKLKNAYLETNDENHYETFVYLDKYFAYLLAKYSFDETIRNKYTKVLNKLYGSVDTVSAPQKNRLKSISNVFKTFYKSSETQKGMYKQSPKYTVLEVTAEEIATLLDSPSLKFNRNFAKYTLMLAGYGGSFRNALGKGLRETEQALYKYNKELDEFQLQEEEWKVVKIFASLLRIMTETSKDLEYEVLNKVIVGLGTYRSFWDNFLHPFAQRILTEEEVKQTKKYHWYPLPNTLRVSRQKVISYSGGKKSKSIMYPLSNLIDDSFVTNKEMHFKLYKLKQQNKSYTLPWGQTESAKTALTLKNYLHIIKNKGGYYLKEYAFIYKKPFLENNPNVYKRNMDKAPISLFIHGLDSTIKDKVKEYFLKAEQGEILTNHDSYAPHSQFAFDFMDIYVQTFKDIMVQEDLLERFAEAYNLTEFQLSELGDWIELQKLRASQEEIKKIIDIPNEFWINMIWNV